MKKLLILAAATSALVATPSLAQSALFSFDTTNSFVRVTSNPTLCLGNCQLSAQLALPGSFSLNVGQSKTFNFANFTVGNGFGFGQANISAQLAFLTPGGAAGTLGQASYLRLGGFFTPGVTTGSLDWTTNSQQITAANGTKYTVSFADLSGIRLGSGVSAPFTVTLDSVAAVPEPASWALMILGFGAVGGMMRSRRREQVKVRFQTA